MSATIRLTTQALDPDRAARLAQFAPALRQQLPPDYVQLLQAYGEGTYAGELFITYPDAENIPATFGEFADLWELDANYSAADLHNSVQLATSADGDILCVVASRPNQVFVLPRHAEQVSSCPTFLAAAARVLPAAAETYFDPSFEAMHTQLSLAKEGQLQSIELVWQTFLRHYAYDFAVRVPTQPKYIIQAIGGWVSFDLVYRSAITIKYQQRYATAAAALAEFLRQQLAYCATR